MVAPLAMLAAALISKKMQDSEQQRQYGIESRKAEEAVRMSIAAQRAARAGDAGYMQRAAGGIVNMPEMGPSNSGAMLAQVGQALLEQRDKPEQPAQTQSVADREALAESRAGSFVPAPQLQTSGYDEDEHKRNYFNSLV